MADEEAFLVVVGVDEPAGDAVDTVAADFAGAGGEHVHALDLDSHLAVLNIDNVNVRFAEDHEQGALASVLEVIGHVQVGVHAYLEDRDAAEFLEFAGVGVVVEGAGDQHVAANVAGLALGREAFHRERTGHADFLLVLVRFVVEALEFGLGSNRDAMAALALQRIAAAST